jgi:hypothetical protein
MTLYHSVTFSTYVFLFAFKFFIISFVVQAKIPFSFSHIDQHISLKLLCKSKLLDSQCIVINIKPNIFLFFKSLFPKVEQGFFFEIIFFLLFNHHQSLKQLPVDPSTHQLRLAKQTRSFLEVKLSFV